MAEERKTEFAGSGVIKKCPNCGAQIEAFQVRCPACGFAISGESRGGSASLKMFLDIYSRESDGGRKTETVRTFPIPNTIEDIIEFSLFAFQQIKSITSGNAVPAPWELNLCAAWYAKLDEARLRASLSFSKDESGKLNFDTLMGEAAGAIDESRKRSEEAARIAAEAQEKAARRKAEDRDKTIKLALKVQEKAEKREAALQLKQAKRQAKFQEKVDAAQYRRAVYSGQAFKKFMSMMFLLGLVVVILWFGVRYLSGEEKRETQRLENLMTEIQADISAGNYDDAELKLMLFKWDTQVSASDQKPRWEEKNALLRKQLESKKRARNNGGIPYRTISSRSDRTWDFSARRTRVA